MIINKNNKILITGAHGFVGRSLVNILKKRGYKNLIVPKKSSYDLRSFDETKKLFQKKKPSVVLHLAGKVGGIGINSKKMGNFFLII